MKNKIAKLTLFSLTLAAIIAVPAAVRAEDKPSKPAAPVIPAAPPKISRQTFHGSVSTVDTAAMTLTVETTVVNITSETKITKGGKPMTLSEITVGETVVGSAKKDDAGKLNATVIRVSETVKTPKQPKKANRPEAAPATK
ncbi:MAG: hypothetical protein RL616_1315 [Verrucomicrobiota bacterium]|jgi:hypothetical protein